MLMLEAATAAGIGDADLVIESDAAALYCLNEYCASLPQVINPSYTFGAFTRRGPHLV